MENQTAWLVTWTWYIGAFICLVFLVKIVKLTVRMAEELAKRDELDWRILRLRRMKNIARLLLTTTLVFGIEYFLK